MNSDTASAEIRGRATAFAVGVRPPPLLIAIVCGICCAAVLLLTANADLNQAGTLDPYFYAGYIHNYADLLQRFGRTYYSSRVAYLYPQRLLTYLFGLEGGYFAFRFAALASAAAAVFAIGQRFYGYAPAILAAVWLSFTPWLPRSLLWTYPDGMAVVYLLIGAALLMVPTRRRLLWHAAAGAAFALAVNCNLFVFGICALLGPGWLFFYRREGAAWLVRAVLALAAGFIAAYFALALLLFVQFPSYGLFFELVTIQQAIWFLGGRGETWYEPLSAVIWQYHHYMLLIPLTLAVAGSFVAAQRPAGGAERNAAGDFAVLAVSYLAGVIALSLFLHVVFHDAWLTIPYYIIYFLPGCTLVFLVLAGEVSRRGGRVFGDGVLYGATFLILALWLARPWLPQPELESSFYFWLVVAVVTAAAALFLRRFAGAVILIVGSVVLSLSLDQSGFYQIRSAGARSASLQWDIYHGAEFLQRFVEANVRPDVSVGFWYTGDPNSFLNSVQSTYLWGYTRVFAERGSGMPVVDDAFRERVAHGILPVALPMRALVMLGLSQAETDAGLNALKAAAIPFHEVARSQFRGAVWGYAAVLVTLDQQARTLGPPLFDLAVSHLAAAADAHVAAVADGLDVVTAAQPGSVSLTGSLRPQLDSVREPLVVRVRLTVEEGAVAVAVSSLHRGLDVIRREDITAGPRPQEVYLDIREPQDADVLTIRNESPAGASRFVIHSVDVLRPD